jgi:hypothetical protein
VSELTTTLTEAFDTANEEGSPDYEPLPKGQYCASITDAKVGPLKSGKGQAVQLTWEVEGDSKYAGRLIFDRVIVAHESADAMKFGRQKFKDIASACGVTEQITDLSVPTEQAVSGIGENRNRRKRRIPAQEPHRSGEENR